MSFSLVLLTPLVFSFEEVQILEVMEGINSKDVQKRHNVPLQMSPSNTENQVARGQGQRVANNMDPKRLKRVAASREYSQRYRLKQLQYTAQLETEVRALQAEVAISFPRIKYADTHNSLLRAENSTMKQKLSACSEKLMLKEAEYHELKKERDALKQMCLLYQAPYAEISQAKHYSYQLVNIPFGQPRFNQFMEAAEPPNSSNQNKGNQFGCDANDGHNRNRM